VCRVFVCRACTIHRDGIVCRVCTVVRDAGRTAACHSVAVDGRSDGSAVGRPASSVDVVAHAIGGASVDRASFVAHCGRASSVAVYRSGQIRVDREYTQRAVADRTTSVGLRIGRARETAVRFAHRTGVVDRMIGVGRQSDADPVTMTMMHLCLLRRSAEGSQVWRVLQ
jgi:hypothetical protein